MSDNGKSEGYGRWPITKHEEITASINEYRLSGYSPIEISKKVNYDLDLVNKKLDILNQRDLETGSDVDANQRRRELDLQYLQIVKSLKELIVDLSDKKDARLKIECHKTIKEVISERARLWQIDGNNKGNADIRMNNVENAVIISGNLDKKTVNLFADVISGKKTMAEIDGTIVDTTTTKDS